MKITPITQPNQRRGLQAIETSRKSATHFASGAHLPCVTQDAPAFFRRYGYNFERMRLAWKVSRTEAHRLWRAGVTDAVISIPEYQLRVRELEDRVRELSLAVRRAA